MHTATLKTESVETQSLGTNRVVVLSGSLVNKETDFEVVNIYTGIYCFLFMLLDFGLVIYCLAMITISIASIVFVWRVNACFNAAAVVF